VAIRADTVLRPVRAPSFHFYVALLFVAIAFGGFARTYLVPVATGRFEGAAILHLHGLLFFAWTVLFTVQSWLVEQRRLEWHRALDYGAATGNDAAARALAIVPTSQILLFAAFVAAGLANVRKPETHKRLMLIATASCCPRPWHVSSP
jgi:hypothetical protein